MSRAEKRATVPTTTVRVGSPWKWKDSGTTVTVLAVGIFSTLETGTDGFEFGGTHVVFCPTSRPQGLLTTWIVPEVAFLEKMERVT